MRRGVLAIPGDFITISTQKSAKNGINPGVKVRSKIGIILAQKFAINIANLHAKIVLFSGYKISDQTPELSGRGRATSGQKG